LLLIGLHLGNELRLLLQDKLELLLLLLLLLLVRHIQSCLLQEQLVKRGIRLSLHLTQLHRVRWGLAVDSLRSKVVRRRLIATELSGDLLVFQKLGYDFESLILLVNCKEVANLQYLLLDLLIGRVIHHESRLEGLDLLLQ